MSVPALFLSLTAIVRPTSLAALYAMMSTRHPQRLLVCYLLAGLSFSVGVGIFVVFALGEWSGGWGRSRSDRPVLDLLFGCCFLVYALVIAIRRPKTEDVTPPRPAALMGRVTANMSPSVAALTGVMTHLPGLVYLAALNAIASTQIKPAGQVVQCSCTTASGSASRSLPSSCRSTAVRVAASCSIGSAREHPLPRSDPQRLLRGARRLPRLRGGECPGRWTQVTARGGQAMGSNDERRSACSACGALSSKRKKPRPKRRCRRRTTKGWDCGSCARPTQKPRNWCP